jgi:hypothetical protein
MVDLASLPAGDLRARLHHGIARRLEARTAEERARAGDDLLDVLHELRRRDEAGPAAHGPHPTTDGVSRSADGGVRTVPAPLRH